MSLKFVQRPRKNTSSFLLTTSYRHRLPFQPQLGLKRDCIFLSSWTAANNKHFTTKTAQGM